MLCEERLMRGSIAITAIVKTVINKVYSKIVCARREKIMASLYQADQNGNCMLRDDERLSLVVVLPYFPSAIDLCELLLA